MRYALRLTAALSAGLLVGCGAGSSPRGEESAARASLDRDLTLRTSAPEAIAVASPVELGRPEPPKQPVTRRRSTPRPAPAPSKAPPRPEASPSPEAVAVPEPVAVAALEAPATVEAVPARNDRELAPGETITVIPVSTGPSNGGSDIGLPAEPGRGLFKGGAGNCPHPPRGIGGRPVGIARLP
jgi:hypothetical protein